SEKCKSQGPSERSIFRRLIQQLLEMDHVEDACTVASYLSSRTERAQAYAEIVMAGKHDKAHAFIHELNELLVSVGGLEEQLDLLSSLGIILFKIGDIVPANNVFERAAELANILTLKTIPTSMSTYVIALARCNSYEDARVQSGEIKIKFVREYVLQLLAAFLRSVAKFDEARTVVHLIPEPYWQARELIIVSKAAVEADHVEQAHDLLNEVIAALNEFDPVNI